MERAPERTVGHTTPSPEERRTSQGLRVVLQVSRFPWGEEPLAWLTGIAQAADGRGSRVSSVMDHLIQIPQVDRAWAPIPEPWVTLGAVAGLGTGLELGTLVTPVTFRPAGVTAKAAATLDALTGGRAFLGVGAGWWDREHAAFGLPFPPAPERLDALERAHRDHACPVGFGHQGVRRRAGQPARDHVLPATRAWHPGDRRRRRRAPHAAHRRAARRRHQRPLRPVDVERKVAVLREHCRSVGRDPAEVAVTVLDLPVVGRDRDDTWARVERLRGNTKAAVYARRSHAGTPADHRERWGDLAARGVDTVFLGLPDLERPDDVERVAPLLA